MKRKQINRNDLRSGNVPSSDSQLHERSSASSELQPQAKEDIVPLDTGSVQKRRLVNQKGDRFVSDSYAAKGKDRPVENCHSSDGVQETHLTESFSAKSSSRTNGKASKTKARTTEAARGIEWSRQAIMLDPNARTNHIIFEKWSDDLLNKTLKVKSNVGKWKSIRLIGKPTRGINRPVLAWVHCDDAKKRGRPQLPPEKQITARERWEKYEKKKAIMRRQTFINQVAVVRTAKAFGARIPRSFKLLQPEEVRVSVKFVNDTKSQKEVVEKLLTQAPSVFREYYEREVEHVKQELGNSADSTVNLASSRSVAEETKTTLNSPDFYASVDKLQMPGSEVVFQQAGFRPIVIAHNRSVQTMEPVPALAPFLPMPFHQPYHVLQPCGVVLPPGTDPQMIHFPQVFTVVPVPPPSNIHYQTTQGNSESRSD